MITITAAAAEQIQTSLADDDNEDLRLRIAARQGADGSFEYAMGLVIDINDGDFSTEISGIPLVVEESNRPLLEGMVIDFVELEEGQPKSFIFLNPNDPNYVPPTDGSLENVPAKNRS
ncbi:MAG: HesB/IscA family protein [Acidiferrobacterales bacterium]